ncbi:MAG: hypothetical protein ACI8UO_001832 [Verrucomicrobiales bacterium]|jgi:hypothetical protein
MAKPKYNWKPEKKKDASGTFRELKDYRRTMYDFKRMPRTVKEYGRMAAMFSERGEVRNFGYRGSEEGIHVSSRPNFTGKDRRSTYKPIKVKFDGIYSDHFGEDAFVVDPLARAIIYKGQWKGRKGGGKDKPGTDKVLEVQGGVLEMRGKTTIKNPIVIENAVRAVRGKANSMIVIRNVDFVNCKTAIKGDGERNPDNGNPLYFNGKPGPCLIYVTHCRFWDCDNVAIAGKNCWIYFDKDSNKISGGGRLRQDGGKIVQEADPHPKFHKAAHKMRRRSSNKWRKKSESKNPLSW